MVAKNKSGSLRKFAIDGIPFNVAADANVSEMLSEFENSLVATSGPNMIKKVKRALTREGLVLITNTDERIVLVSFADSLEDYPLSYTNQAGDTFRATGTIEIEGNETEENRTTVQALPVGKWTPFVGQV